MWELDKDAKCDICGGQPDSAFYKGAELIEKYCDDCNPYGKEKESE